MCAIGYENLHVFKQINNGAKIISRKKLTIILLNLLNLIIFDEETSNTKFDAMQEQMIFHERVSDGMRDPLKMYTVYKDVRRDL